jgi:hypothetical protein
MRMADFFPYIGEANSQEIGNILEYRLHIFWRVYSRVKETPDLLTLFDLGTKKARSLANI